MLTLSPTYAELVRANEALQARLAEAERALATLQSREQPQAEHAPADSPLSRLAERLNLATRAAHMGVWDWDIQQNELVWDDRMYELYGVPREAFGGAYETWLQGLHPDDRAANNLLSAQARRGECPYDTEFRVVWPDGSIRILKALGEVVWDAAGTPLRMIGVNYDITERKQTEAALRESEQRMRSLLEHVPIGMFQSTPEGHFIYVNPTLAAMLDYASPEELLTTVNQTTIAQALYEDPARRPQLLSEVGQVQERWRVYENRYRRKHGAIFDAILTVSQRIDPISEQPTLYGFVQDITERKQAETALRQLNETLEQRVTERTTDLSRANAALARANRLKDEFLATISHELRTPLNAILGRAELLQEELYGTLTLRQMGAVRGIETSGRHLLALINDILDLSSIEAGRLKLEIEPTSVASVCQLSLQLVAANANAKQLTLSSLLDPQVTVIPADARRLTQILVNLLTNAIKFTPREGAIGLEVRGDPATQTVMITVWDTGIGIAEADLPRLFQPFVQIDSGLNRHYEGTGLGLSLVRRLAEAHQGRVTVVSAPGHGSRFSVVLPWPDAPQRSAGQPMEPQASVGSVAPLPPARPNILLVDDNQEHRQLVEDYLTAHGYAVHVACNGEEAIALAQAEAPAVVLMDIQMPQMDGLEAIRRLRNDAQLRAVPILALTALAMPEDRERCLAAGATAYLSKPVRLHELLAIVKTLLNA